MMSADSAISAKSGCSTPSDVLVQCRSPTAATRTRSAIIRRVGSKMRAAHSALRGSARYQWAKSPRHVPCHTARDDMPVTQTQLQILEPEARAFYCQTLGVFEKANLDVLVGGAYAFARYTGIERHTKDLTYSSGSVISNRRSRRWPRLVIRPTFRSRTGWARRTAASTSWMSSTARATASPESTTR